MKVKILTAIGVFLTITLIPKNSLADEKIANVIKKLTPSISDDMATTIANNIQDMSTKYSIDWKIFVAIFKQESNFNIRAINYKSRDFGLGQLHYTTIESRNVELGRLLTDSAYAIEETAKILAQLRQTYDKIDKKQGRTWYTRYHSFIPSHREKYNVLLAKHISVIEGVLNERQQRNKYQGTGTAGKSKVSEWRSNLTNFRGSGNSNSHPIQLERLGAMGRREEEIGLREELPSQ